MPGVTCYVADKEACWSTRKPRAEVPPPPKISARSIVVATTPPSDRTSVSPRRTIAPGSTPSHISSTRWTGDQNVTLQLNRPTPTRRISTVREFLTQGKMASAGYIQQPAIFPVTEGKRQFVVAFHNVYAYLENTTRRDLWKEKR